MSDQETSSVQEAPPNPPAADGQAEQAPAVQQASVGAGDAEEPDEPHERALDNHERTFGDPPDEANVHPDEEQIWRKRARAYDSRYKGPEHWRRALNVIASTGSIPLARRELGISSKAFNDRRERYPEFAEEIVDALAFFREATLERAAVARAVDGILKPVWHKGDHVGYERVYSDTLLGKLLEANMPDKYKQKVELSTPNKITITGGLQQEKSQEELAIEEAAKLEASGVVLTAVTKPP